MLVKSRVFPVVLWFGLCLAGAFPAVEAVAQSWIIQPIESKAQSTDDLSAVLDVGYAGVSIDEHTSRQLNNYLLTSFAAVGFKAKSGFGAGLGAGLGAEYIEWFGMNLGGGYVYHTGSFGRVDLHIATINWPSVYYTVLEANVLPIYGMAGVGGRLGWRKAFGKAEIRVGLRWGFAYWLGGTLDSDDEFDYDKWGDSRNAFWYGSDLTPHFQILGRFSHGHSA